MSFSKEAAVGFCCLGLVCVKHLTVKLGRMEVFIPRIRFDGLV